MNPNLYQAAATGDIVPFDETAIDELGSMVTYKKNTVLHINIASRAPNGEAGSVSTEFVKQILEMCPSLLVQVNANGDSPLHLAAKYGHAAVVGALIEFAKKQPKELESGVETVRLMLEMKNADKNTALHEAVQYQHDRGSLDVVRMLMKADPDVPYSPNGSGETPLYIAAARGSRMTVAEILKSCPSAAHEGPNGKTALHAAVRRDAATDISASNLQHMAKLLLGEKKDLATARDHQGWTALHYAAYFGAKKIPKLLLEFDKSAAYIPDNGRKMTALHLAAGRGKFRAVEEIISHCPDCCELVDDRGWSVLHFAMVSYNASNLKHLLDRYPMVRSLINDKDVEGNTPLHLLAAVCRDSASISYILSPYPPSSYFKAVNNQNISAGHIVRFGNPELQQKIQDLSEDVGSGQYPDGLIKLQQQKLVLLEGPGSFWEYLDEEAFKIKEAAEHHLLVAALIATVTFAAAFALPGGYRAEEGPNQGTAILSRNTAFQAFIITDAIALVFSLSAVFVHFIMSLKAFKRFIFLFVFALLFTMTAMGAMMVAFATGIYAVLAPSLGLAIANSIIGLSFFLLAFFMILLVFFMMCKVILKQTKIVHFLLFLSFCWQKVRGGHN